jgi:uncharacterized protein YpmS
MTLSELTKEDYLSLIWHFLLLAVCVLLVGAFFYGVSALDTAASRELNVARGDLSNAQASLEQIEEEETTITTYIEPYLAIAEGAVAGTDRLDMQETFAQIRSRYSLFPIQLDIAEESSYLLPYAPEIAQPGGPVNLMISKISTGLPLLHENDLANYLDALVAAPSLVVPMQCTLTSSTRDSRALLRLGQHLRSSCSFAWYSFQVAGENGVQP